MRKYYGVKMDKALESANKGISAKEWVNSLATSFEKQITPLFLVLVNQIYYNYI